MASDEFSPTNRSSYFGGSACIFLNASLIIYIVAFSTPFWFNEEGSYNLGLWSACYKTPVEVIASQNNTLDPNSEYKWECIEATKWIGNVAPGFQNDWLAGMEAILTISLIFHIVTSITMIYYVGYPTVKKNVSQAIVFGSFCLTFGAASFTLTAIIVCGSLVTQEDSAVFRSDLSWSYFLALTSSIVHWFCAAALMVEVVKVMTGSPVTPSLTTSPTFEPMHGNHCYVGLQQRTDINPSTLLNEAIERENEAAAVEWEINGVNSSTNLSFT